LETITSANTSVLSSIIRFNPWLLALFEDLTGGQTYNIIPSRVKLPEDSAKVPGIASDGSGLSATLYFLKRRLHTSHFRSWFDGFSNRRNTLKNIQLGTLTSYLQLANDSIHEIDVTNEPFNNQLKVSFVIQSGEYTANVPLSFMSDGTLKWLALITAALTATSVFSIEEPENYLHPQMQAQFINIIREILFNEKRESCTLMTTHSETLLNHCKPSELVIVSLRNGATVVYRCKNQREISREIEKTGFGLGYYYTAGAIDDE
jgi:predicted ATPase